MSNLAINERKPKFKIPIKKIIIKKTIIKLAILLIVLGIAIHLGNRGVQYTQTDQFCASCHNRSAYFETRDASSHARFSCNSCHIQWNELSEANLRQVAREVYVHFTNQQPPDFFLGKVRVEDRICLQCHSYARDATPSGDLIIPHEPHADKKVQCITCHRNIVHGQQVFKGIDATPAIDYGDKMVRPNLDSTTPMGVCMNCHSRRQVSVECGVCHTDIKKPKDHLGGSFLTTHGLLARQDVGYCDSCHRYSVPDRHLFFNRADIVDYSRANPFCADCHREKPPGHLGDSFIIYHGRMGSIDSCLICHNNNPGKEGATAYTQCGQCHSQSHRAGWEDRHPIPVAKDSDWEKECYTCHRQSTCVSCHRR